VVWPIPTKKIAGSQAWIDPDDAPELPDAFFADAELYQGE
jgi:hypothetical protein